MAETFDENTKALNFNKQMDPRAEEVAAELRAIISRRMDNTGESFNTARKNVLNYFIEDITP